MNSELQEIRQIAIAIEDGLDAVETLNELPEQTTDEVSDKIMTITIESISNKLGIPNYKVAVEGGVSDVIKTIIDKIKAAFKWLIDKIKGMFGKESKDNSGEIQETKKKIESIPKEKVESRLDALVKKDDYPADFKVFAHGNFNDGILSDTLVENILNCQDQRLQGFIGFIEELNKHATSEVEKWNAFIESEFKIFSRFKRAELWVSGNRIIKFSIDESKNGVKNIIFAYEDSGNPIQEGKFSGGGSDHVRFGIPEALTKLEKTKKIAEKLIIKDIEKTSQSQIKVLEDNAKDSELESDIKSQNSSLDEAGIQDKVKEYQSRNAVQVEIIKATLHYHTFFASLIHQSDFLIGRGNRFVKYFTTGKLDSDDGKETNAAYKDKNNNSVEI